MGAAGRVFMDITTIIGIVLGFALLLIEGKR